MKFLAFDIEAANGYLLSSICSIGIVIASQDFDVTTKTNLWINPKTKYNLNGTRKNVGIDLHLDKELLSHSPDFSQVFDQIKALLTDPQTIVVGHAVDSDARMLNAACKRYKLPSIDFKFVCSQLLYMLYKGEKEVKALSKIAAELDLNYNQHNSEDDAWMSLKTLEYVLKSSKLTLHEFLLKYGVRVGENKNFELMRSVAIQNHSNKRAEINKQLSSLKEFCTTIKVVGNCFKDKTFAVARSLELLEDDKAKSILTAICQNGGKYSTKLKNCNCFVVADQPTDQDKMREKRVNELKQAGLIQTFSLNQLFEVANAKK